MRRVVVLLAPLALLLTTAFTCQSVSPEPEPAAATAPEAAPESVQTIERMLSLEVTGQVIGVVETRLELHADGSRTTREVVNFSMTREGGGADATFSSTSETVSTHDPAHELISEIEVQREAGVTITRTLELEGRELVSSYSGPGRPEEVKRFALPDDYRSSLAVDFELVQEWAHTKQPATRRYASFDAERERFKPVEVTILGELEFRHGDELIPAYRYRTVEEDGTVIEAIVDHELTPLHVDMGGMFVAELVDAPPTLGGQGRINSELPVAGRTTNHWWELAEQQVTVEVDGDADNATPLWDDTHYHQVERSGSSYAMKLLSTRPDQGFVAPKLPLKIDDPQIRRYLEPTSMAQSDNPAIVAEAKRIVGGETNSIIAAAKIVESVFDTIDKQAGVRGSATALEVLQNGAGDCTEHAVLVVALMRAAGIPARAVDGIVLASDQGGMGVAGYHAWAEIWLGQWIGVDATVNETGTSARYLEFGVDEPGEVGSGGKMMRAIGKTKIELGPHMTYEEQAR